MKNQVLQPVITTQQSDMLDIAIQAAKQAGALLKKNFNTQHTIAYKDKNNVVTESDTQSEKIILDLLRHHFPSHSFYSEEAGEGSETIQEYRWIIDPLDGTTNFSRHFGHFCVSIALARNNETILGVVYQPLTEELFWAERGKGAYLNGQPIQPSTCRELPKAVAMFNRGTHSVQKARYTKIFPLITDRVRSLRVAGALALDACYVGCGKFDMLIANGCKFYDCAAASLIAKEAGNAVTDFEGADWVLKDNDFLVCNPVLHSKIVKLLRSEPSIAFDWT